MPAPLRNQNALRFPTREARQALFHRWVAHRKSGFARHTFRDCDERTIDRYARDFPEDFPPDEMDAAERACEHHWEKIAMASCLGQTKAHPVSIIFQLVNRFPKHWKRRPTPVGADPSPRVIFGFPPSQFARVPTSGDLGSVGVTPRTLFCGPEKKRRESRHTPNSGCVQVRPASI